MENVLNEKLFSYFVQLNDAEKESVLHLLKTFLESRPNVVDQVSVDQYNKEIDEALAEAAEGNYITQEEMEKQAAKWWGR